MKLFANNTQRNAKLLRCAAFGMTLVFLGAAIFMTDPQKHIVDWQLSLSPSAILYRLWLFPPIDVYITVYMFNYTNVEAFMAGTDDKLKIEEIGPYTYKEVLSNHNITLNSNNTITFTPRREYIFVPERSVGDPKVDRIRAPNIPYMGVSTHATSISMIAALGLSALVKRLNAQPMVNVTVHDYMWGYEDHLVGLASKFVPSYIDFPSFGIMEKLFREGNESNVINMHLPELKDGHGVKLPNSPRAYSLHSINGKRGYKHWNYDESTNGTQCNRIWGSYDATLFPRDLEDGEDLFIYRGTFCRLLPMKYRGRTSFDGLDAVEYTMETDSFDSVMSNQNTSCYCKNGHCLKKGLGSVSPCYYNMPLAISFPHFLDADPSFLEPFEGLNPNATRFTSKVLLQQQVGVPLHAHVRLQANQVVGKIKFDRAMQSFENMVLPILWIDLTIDHLNMPLQMLAHFITTGCPLLQAILALALILTGFYQLSAALMLCFWTPPPGMRRKSDHGEKRLSILNASINLAATLRKASTAGESMQQEVQKLLSNEASTNHDKLSEV